MRAHRRWLLIGGLALSVVGLAAGDEPAKTPAAPPTKGQLDKLLKLYRTYELPFPPADAALVQFELLGQQFGLGFRARDPRTGELGPVFAGTRPLDVGIKSVVVVEPEPDAVDGFRQSLGVELAVQCHARGWTTLAWKVLEEVSADPSIKPEVALARVAWDHWLYEFRKPTTDRATVARVLKAAIKDQPDEFTVRERSVLGALELSLVPGQGKAGTVEALIDGLIEVNKTDRSCLRVDISDVHPAYLAVARRGFVAVPELIAHLNDERLTRTVGDERYTVADVVGDLLQSLAGEAISREWARTREGRVAPADVEAWWAAAGKAGEEAYFVDHVLGNPECDNLVDRVMLDLLARKYPKRLPEIYRQMVTERPNMLGWELGEAVAGSALPRETKRELFLEAAKGKGVAIRIDCIWRLYDIDRPKGKECLLAELVALPKTPEEDYWECPEGRLPYLVAHVNEPAAWDALEGAAKRADVGLRLELLGALRRWDDQPEAVAKAYRQFRSRFLDDAAVRDEMSSPKFSGPGAAFTFPKIEVRNYAAAGLANDLGLPDRPTPDWTDEQWAKLRDDVKKALAREGIR